MVVLSVSWISRVISVRKYSYNCSKIMDDRTGDISSLIRVRNSVPHIWDEFGERVVNVIVNGK